MLQINEDIPWHHSWRNHPSIKYMLPCLQRMGIHRYQEGHTRFKTGRPHCQWKASSTPCTFCLRPCCLQPLSLEEFHQGNLVLLSGWKFWHQICRQRISRTPDTSIEKSVYRFHWLEQVPLLWINHCVGSPQSDLRHLHAVTPPGRAPKFQHALPYKPQDAPHSCETTNYGAATQYSKSPDPTPMLPPQPITLVHKIIETLI